MESELAAAMEPNWPEPGPDAWAAPWVMDGDAPGEEPNPVYDWTWNDALHRITSDAAWTSWWAEAKRPRLEIRGELTRNPGPPVLSYARDAVRLRYPVHVQRLATTDRNELAARAHTDMTLVMQLLTRRLRLPSVPPLPARRPVDLDVPDRYGYIGVTQDEVRTALLSSGLDASVIAELVADPRVLEAARDSYEHY